MQLARKSGIKLIRGGGNILLYPQEDLVRFLNLHVRKRVNPAEFRNVMSSVDWNDFASLDLGCGMGRHIRLLDEFGLNPYGIDLSKEAIEMSKLWFSQLNRRDLIAKVSVASVTDVPFEDNKFSLCISMGVLDSMPRETADNGMKEVRRVLKKGGLFFLSMIVDDKIGNKDIIQESGYEKDTVQSYSTSDGVKDFISSHFDILDYLLVTRTNVRNEIIGQRAFVICE